MRSNRCPQYMEGAPNFRMVSGMPVYGVAIPTVQGARDVLRQASWYLNTTSLQYIK